MFNQGRREAINKGPQLDFEVLSDAAKCLRILAHPQTPANCADASGRERVFGQ